jgi:chromate reductase, NAD(P)H dehydrogenase (quinone)
MTYPIHILGISGSLRAHSVNSGLLRAAGEVLPENVSLEIFDISALPFFNDELLQDGKVPEAVKDFKAQIAEADALLIATPEYNYSIPGVLKIAIEWASRPVKDSPLNDKPLAIMGAGGKLGTGRAQYHLRQMMVGANMHLVNRPEVLVQFAHQKFDAKGNLTDEATRQEVKALVAALVVWTRRLQGGGEGTGLMERAKVREVALV